MKKHRRLLASLVCGLIILFTFLSQGQAQSNWEGKFMEQFLVNIQLDGLGSGVIKMYDGPNQIQNDGLVKVKIEECRLTFNIPAKQTDFEGHISEAGTKISGNFIFPDGGLHPLILHKVTEQTETGNLITNIAAVEDLHQLYAALKEMHPRPFAYTSPAEFDRLYSVLTHITDESLSLNELYLKAAQLTEAIKCSHTGVRLPFNPRAPQTEIPLEVFFADDNLYVLQSPNEMIPAGSLITRINERDCREIIDDLKILVPVDGENKTTKANVINRQFKTLLPKIDKAEEYLVQFNDNGETREVKIAAREIPGEDVSGHDLVIFEPRSAQLAYLKIPSFGISDMDQYFASLENIFKQLKTMGSKNLILDLRDNSGGHPIFAAQLLSYLTDQEFTYFKRNLDVPDFEPLYNPMQPNARHYTGNLYVFVNGGCLSTSGHLISLLKQYTPAKFIGEEPGSTYTCNDFSKKITLGNSKLELNIPTTIFETAVDGAAREVPFPIDYKVEETLLGKLTGKDAYWETYRKAIIPQEVY